MLSPGPKFREKDFSEEDGCPLTGRSQDGLL